MHLVYMYNNVHLSTNLHYQISTKLYLCLPMFVVSLPTNKQTSNEKGECLTKCVYPGEGLSHINETTMKWKDTKNDGVLLTFLVSSLITSTGPLPHKERLWNSRFILISKITHMQYSRFLSASVLLAFLLLADIFQTAFSFVFC